MKPTMTLIDESGKEIECTIVAKWSDGNINYVAYTDGSETDGELDLFISKYETTDDGFNLIPITQEAEWKRVNDFLDNMQLEDGD